jgi:hypothetical protein
VNGDTQNASVLVESDNRVEGDETIDLQLQNLVAPTRTDAAIDAANNLHAVTIDDSNDDSGAAQLGFCEATTTTSEGQTRPICVELQLAPGDELAISLTVDVIDLGSGTATDPDDYTLSVSQVTFPAGSVNGDTQDASVLVESDNLVEGDETVDLELRNLVAPTRTDAAIDAANDLHTVTIDDSNDDNGAAQVGFCAATTTTSEGVTQTVCVELQLTPGDELAIPLTVGVVDLGTGTATDPDDFTLGVSQVTFAAGSVDGDTQDASVLVESDSLVEGDETIDLQLQNLVAPTRTDAGIDGANDSHTVTIDDSNDDSVTVGFCESTSNGDEGTTHPVCATLQLASGDELAIPLSVDVADLGTGTATSPDDYAFSVSQVTFPVGSVNNATQNASVLVASDNLVEGDETIDLELENLVASRRTDAVIDAANNLHTVTIEDANLVTAEVCFTTDASAGDEGSQVTVLVELGLAPNDELATPITVQINDLGGDAVTPGDYDLVSDTVTFPVGSVDGDTQALDADLASDNLVEGDEAFTLRLEDANTGTGNSIALCPDIREHAVTIQDQNPAQLRFQEATSNASESTSPHAFDVELVLTAGDELATPVSVSIVDLESGTATPGDDYTLDTTSLTFAVGSVGGATRAVNMSVASGDGDEPNETAIFQLQNAAGDAPNTDVSISQPNTHTVTILDEDPPPEVSLVVDSDNMLEAGGRVEVTLGLSETSGKVVEVPLTFGGTASFGVDYRVVSEPNGTPLAQPISVTIPAGVASGVVFLEAIGDDNDDPDETIVVEIDDAGVVNAEPVAPTGATITLNDDPMTAMISGTVWVDIDDDGVRDDGETVLPGVAVTLSGEDQQGQTVEITTTTDSAGAYRFARLPSGTYTIRETQPAAFLDGQDVLGTVAGQPSGTVGEDEFSGIVLPPAGRGVNYNFGEGSLRTDSVSRRIFLSSNRLSNTLVREIMVDAELREGNTQRAAAIERGQDVEVRRIGSEVTVLGTAAVDEVTFTPAVPTGTGSTQEHVLNTNGVERRFSAAEVTAFFIDGRGDHDDLLLQDSDRDDALQANHGSISMEGPEYRVEAIDFEVVEAISDSGGDDTSEVGAIDYVLELEGDWRDIS